MKKTALLFLLFAGGTPLAQAQKVKFGIKAGASFTQLSGESWDSETRANALGGIFLRSEGARFSLQGEAVLSQGAYTTTTVRAFPLAFYNNLQDSLKQGRFRVNYLSIPVLIGVKVAGPLWLQAGPQFSSIVGVNDKDELVKDAKDIFKSGSIDAVGGLWLNLGRHVNAGARVVFGLSNIRDAQGAGESWRQRAYQVHLGYSF